jgi:hypothetical protein
MNNIKLLGRINHDNKIEYILRVENSSEKPIGILTKLESSFRKDNPEFMIYFKGERIMDVYFIKGPNYGLYHLRDTIFPDLKKLVVVTPDLNTEESLYGIIMSDYINKRVEDSFRKLNN